MLALRSFREDDAMLFRTRCRFPSGGHEISARSATKTEESLSSNRRATFPIQYLRGDASWPTMAHNTLVEEKPPRWPPTRCAMRVCLYVCVGTRPRAVPEKRVKVSLTVPCTVCTRVHACGYVRARITRGLYRIGGQQITLISTKQYSYRFSAGVERRVQGCAYIRDWKSWRIDCCIFWEFRKLRS